MYFSTTHGVYRGGLRHACRDNGKRFVVRADERLTAFLELESAIRGSLSFTRPCTVQRHSAGTETYD
jgi:hypothetical protein